MRKAWLVIIVLSLMAFGCTLAEREQQFKDTRAGVNNPLAQGEVVYKAFNFWVYAVRFEGHTYLMNTEGGIEEVEE